MKAATKRLFLGAALLTHGRGGITSVARQMIKALDDYDLQASSFLDVGILDVAGRQCRGASGRKLNFTWLAWAAALSRSFFIYDSAGIGRAHARMPGLRRPYAVWIHGIEAWEALTPDRKRVIDSATLVLANSQYTLSRYTTLHGSLPQAKICALATEEDDPVTPADFSGPAVVLMLSRIDKTEGYKGHDKVIEAWPQVVARAPGSRLVIAGGGSGLGALRELASQSSAASSIECKGFIPADELEALWRSAHVFCMPSRGEGFGIVYIEAMRYGIPVIASIHDAGQEVNLDGVTGFNVDLDRPSELVDRLTQLLVDPEHSRKLGDAGRQRWFEHFRFSAFQARFRAALAEVFL